MNKRVQEELPLLMYRFPDTCHVEKGNEDWFLIPEYPLPEGWLIEKSATSVVPVGFSIPAVYPGKAPYGFYVPMTLSHRGGTPTNSKAVSGVVPFEGEWRFVSWNAQDWSPGSTPSSGSNILTWVFGFGERFSQGA